MTILHVIRLALEAIGVAGVIVAICYPFARAAARDMACFLAYQDEEDHHQ